jgi:hypothetical protein
MRRRRVLEDIVQCIARQPGRFLQRTNDDCKSSGGSSWRVLSHNEALAKTKRALQYRAAAAAALARPLCRIRDGGRSHHPGDVEPNDRDWMVPSALPPERAAAPTTAVSPAKMVLGTTPPLHHAHHPLATTTTTSTTVETTTTAFVTVDTDSVSLSIVEQPERNDVVLGRGKRYQSHPGNVFFDGTKAYICGCFCGDRVLIVYRTIECGGCVARTKHDCMGSLPYLGSF